MCVKLDHDMTTPWHVWHHDMTTPWHDNTMTWQHHDMVLWHQCTQPLLYMCDTNAPWLIHTCHDSFMRAPWFIHICHDSYTCDMNYSHVPWLIHVCHDSFKCAMTHIHGHTHTATLQTSHLPLLHTHTQKVPVESHQSYLHGLKHMYIYRYIYRYEYTYRYI